MIHASIFTLIIALAAGLTVISLSALTYVHYRTRHLLAHLYLVTSINLIVLAYVATLYFYQNMLPEVPPSISSAVDNANQVVLPGLQVAALASLLYLARLMLGDKITHGYFRSYGYFPAVVVLIQIVLAKWQPYVSDVPVLYLVFRAVEVVTLLGAYVILVVMSVRAPSVRPVAKGKTLRIYAGLLLVHLTLIVLADAAELTKLINPSAHALVGAILVLSINLVPVVYRRVFFAPGFGAPIGQEHVVKAGTDLNAEFGISAREKEVLMLICEGRSNQEIADILYISLQTVKDHTSRIYRKTGVKNRVQLIAFLKDYGPS